MKINIEDLKFEFTLKKNMKILAIMNLQIGQFTIKGFKVMESKFKRFALFPPSTPTGHNKWFQIFWTGDKESWKKLEEAAIKQFDEEQTESMLKETSNSDEINVEDVRL
jgi:hypothetical protein